MSSDRGSSPPPKKEPSPDHPSVTTKDIKYPQTLPMEQSGSSTPVPTLGPGGASTPPDMPPTRVLGGQTKTQNGSSGTAHSGEGEEGGHDPRPAGELESFNWDELNDRFQEMVQTRDGEEEKLWEEFHELIGFFNIWAATTHTHEVDRSIKRLATRMRYVQTSEAQVEQKREHYVRVVKAFESALELLNGS